MSNARRIAERMILDRAANCHRIAEELRMMAIRLETDKAGGDRGPTLDDEARGLRALADQLEKL